VQVHTVCCQVQITLHNLVVSRAMKLVNAEFTLNFMGLGPVKV
jgi:hypothetical protein